METGIAKRYAQALFMIAEETGRKEAFAKDLDFVTDTIDGHKDLKALFYGAQFSHMDKKAVTTKIFSNEVAKEVLNFVLLLVEKSRYAYLPDIRSAYHHIYDEDAGIQDVTVYAPYPLTEEEKEQIRARVREHDGQEIRIKEVADPSLIAGVRIQIKDTIIDGSVKSRLEQMRKQLVENRK